MDTLQNTSDILQGYWPVLIGFLALIVGAVRIEFMVGSLSKRVTKVEEVNEKRQEILDDIRNRLVRIETKLEGVMK